MQFQWYPGHMTKAKRQMQEDIKLIDLVIELVDARVPLSSRNPDIDDLGKNKARLILLNKSDLADDAQNEKWIEYFKAKGYHALKINSKNKSGIKEINNVVNEACKEKIERDRKRGIKNRPVRAMAMKDPQARTKQIIKDDIETIRAYADAFGVEMPDLDENGEVVGQPEPHLVKPSFFGKSGRQVRHT